MELQSISQVSKQFSISPRTLRYYEQIGLISSVKKADFAYRTYDEDTIMRLRQIIVLRKLRIPLKQIIEILKSDGVETAIEAFENNLSEIEDEITALSTIRSIIKSFIEKFNLDSTKLALLDDEYLLEIVDSLTVSKIYFKEEKTMDDLNKASEKLSKLTDRDVRIVYLPPSDVAAYQYEGDEPETHVNQMIDSFVLNSSLTVIKPDVRHYGFNAPNPVDESNHHGYEMWVTIPDGFTVPAPLVKKRFEGGLYAAHMIPFGSFAEWGWLMEWAMQNKKYEYRGDWNSANQFGCLEEYLNYVNRVNLPDSVIDGLQLDLFVPIKERT
jgi:DNA-binding transcriptional MerR regulator